MWNVARLTVIVFCLFWVRNSIKELIAGRGMIAGLALNDLKLKYAGSTLGIFWAFVQPTLTTLIYWFVFQLGFKSQPVADFPFILWLIAGLTPWFYFGETILSGTAVVNDYSYLVKKVMFNVNILPAVKTVAMMLVQVIFICFVCVLFLLYGVGLSIYAVQIVYYAFAMLILAMGLVYLFSALQVFLKDVVQIISALMQLVFWSVPIVWDISVMPEMIQNVLKLNPLYYIVEGYRDALINQVWFWEKIPQTIGFWFTTVILFAVGTKVFHRLKPHFADVL